MVELKEINSNQLSVYATIPIFFVISTIFKVELVNNGLGGILLNEESITKPIIKNYDTSLEGGPLNWPTQFDIQNWGFFLAQECEIPLAGCAIANNTNGINMLEGRTDLSVLWDIRVLPAYRRNGIGKSLFKCAIDWSRNHGCRQMKIETQNINTAACNFYCSMGCTLGAINRFAYFNDPDVSQEVMLNWYIDLK